MRLTWKLTLVGTLYSAETYIPIVPYIFPILCPCYPPGPILRRLLDPVQNGQRLPAGNPIYEPPEEVVEQSWRRPPREALNYISCLFDALPNLSNVRVNSLNIPGPAPLERPEFECSCPKSGVDQVHGLRTFTFGDYSVCIPGDTWLRGLATATSINHLHTLNLLSLRAKDFRDLGTLLEQVGSSLKHLSINVSRFSREELGTHLTSTTDIYCLTS